MSEQFAPDFLTEAMRTAREGGYQPFLKFNAQTELVRVMHTAVAVFPKPEGVPTNIWGMYEETLETPAIPAIDETDPDRTAGDKVLLKGNFRHRKEPEGLQLSYADITVVGVFPGNERQDLCNIRATRYSPTNLTRVRAFAPYGEVNEPVEMKKIANRVLCIARNLPKQ